MAAGMDVGGPREPGLVRLGGPMLGMLAVQFVLGMLLNLFVALPSGAGAAAVLESSPVLILHLVLGVLLLGIAVRATLLSRGATSFPLRLAGPLALGSGLVAFLAGVSFAFGGQSASASLVMSLGFVGMTVAAAVLLGASGRASGQGRPNARDDSGPAAGSSA